MTLRNLVRELPNNGKKKIILNLRDVSFMDSAGMGELVRSLTTVRTQGGDLKLLNVPKRVRDLLQITKLLSIFDVKDDEAAAVASFGCSS